MTPYYQDDAVTIYHGDCAEVMPRMDVMPLEADLLLTDPPYVGMKGTTIHSTLGGVGKTRTDSLAVGDPWTASLDWFPAAWGAVRLGALVFCSPHFIGALGDSVLPEQRLSLLTWYKRNAPIAVNNVPRFDTEFIWAFRKHPGLNWRLPSTMFDIPSANAGCVSSGERYMDNRLRALHPTQKPLALMRRLILPGAELILDPFCGTGTTLRAAKDLGRKAIGIEIEERYCEIAAKRCAQEVLPL